MNRDEHEEEERNSHANGHDRLKEDRRENDHQENNFKEDNHRDQRNGRANHCG